MLEFSDFSHPPEMEQILAQLAADGPGLTVVAGLDLRQPLSAGDDADPFLFSGRATIFRMLLRRLLEAGPRGRLIAVVENRDAIRAPRHLRSRVELVPVEQPDEYAWRIAAAAARRPALLAIEHLTSETIPAALEAARGLRVLSQMDTIFRGTEIAGALLEQGASREQLASLRWTVAVQRLPALCPRCREIVLPDAAQLAELRRRYGGTSPGPFYRAAGCSACNFTGHSGAVAAFDIFHVPTPASAAPRAKGTEQGEAPHGGLLPLETYALYLAQAGNLALPDLLELETDRLRRTVRLFTAGEHALRDSNISLQRRLVELEAAHRVLQGRTQALVSLEAIAQALLSPMTAGELASQVCRYARELCGADRAILYCFCEPGAADMLAVSGWDPARVPDEIDASYLLDATAGAGDRAERFDDWPPGIAPRHADVEGAVLRAGLRVPLIAQGEPVGAMIVHTTTRTGFSPGEVALLQALAGQAALAIQRTRLIEQLQAKISELEAAQRELVEKERMERELELARQVQQSVLPRTFPNYPGYCFAARNEPARRVGGDFYDVVPLGPDRFGVVIADVSDKGMPAALYMALTRSLLLAEARREPSPAAVIANVNDLLRLLGEPDMFVTIFYGVIERRTRELIYVRAGHDRPLLLRTGEVHELGGQGGVLGLFDATELGLSEERTTLLPGDRLVLFTDGLTDAVAPDGAPFGLARLHTLLSTHAHLPPAGLCDAAFEHLIGYQQNAEQYDDMALLVLAVE
jgi:serine phosphatase RsbU (regulator of sigma subunit)